MVALACVLLGFTALTAYQTSKLPRGLARVYLSSVIGSLVLGVLSIVAYTMDNEVLHGQVDMPGDAQYYFDGAMSYLVSGVTQTYYPVYERYLAAFLREGGPFLARFGQLLTWLLAFSATVWALASQQVTATGLRRFSFLVVGSGLYYGLVTVFNRDILILAGLALIYALVVKSEELVRRPAFLLFLVLAIAAVVVWLNTLQPWLTPVLIAALLMEYAVWGISGLRGPDRRAYWKVLAVLVVFLGSLTMLGLGEITRFIGETQERITRLIHDVVVEGTMVELGGATRDVLAPFRLAFGPGLIRPLFPSQYFQVWVPTHVAFYWWGTLFWYLALLLGVPALVRRPAGFFGRRGAILLLTLFAGYFGAYLFAYGSGIGLRKRALLAYLFTTFLASSYWTLESPIRSRIARWQTRVPRGVVVLVLVILLGIAQLSSV